MKKLLYTLSLLTLPLFLFGQTYLPAGNATLQKTTAPTIHKWRWQTGTAGYYYPPDQATIDTQFLHRPPLPVGLYGQVLKVSKDNSNKYTPAEPLIYGQFIYTDEQKSRAFAAGSATQLQIFNSFKRYSHGLPQSGSVYPASGAIPGIPLETNTWSYDTVSHSIKSTINSVSAIGFFSNDRFDTYVHTLTLGSNSTYDNDRVGVILAFAETADSVINNAYGLNPADFNWPINTTSQKIPNQHTLGVYFNREGMVPPFFTPIYSIIYDYRKTTEKIILNGSSITGLYSPTTNWNGASLDVKINRNTDTITVLRTQFSDAPGGKGSLGFQLSINLSSDTTLYKFKGSQPYGYVSQSLDNSFFSNIYFSGSSNVVYDLRNGDTYPFTSAGYVIDPTKNMYIDLGTRFFWRNKIELTFGYILSTNTFDVIVGPQP